MAPPRQGRRGSRRGRHSPRHLARPVETGGIQALEPLADAEEEHAKHEDAAIARNATASAMTSGIPATLTAASIRPFSSAMKPTTCVSALRRTIISSSPSSTTDSASARSSRVSPRRGQRDRQHDDDGERHQADAHDHARDDAERGLDRAMDVEPPRDATQRDREHDAVDRAGNERDQIEACSAMRRSPATPSRPPAPSLAARRR